VPKQATYPNANLPMDKPIYAVTMVAAIVLGIWTLELVSRLDPTQNLL
jgi:hypothetical protein